MLKKYLLILFLLGTSLLFSMEQENFEPEEMQEQTEINSEIEATNVIYLKKPSKLVKLCARAIASLLFEQKKSLDFNNILKLPKELQYKIESALYQNYKTWTILKNHISYNLLNHFSLIPTLAISSDNKYIATCSWDKTAKIWNPNSGECLCIFQGHSGMIDWIALTKNNKFIITFSSDHTVKIWNTKSGICDHTIEEDTIITAVAINSDGKFIFTGDSNGTIKIWDIESGEYLSTITEIHNYVTGLTISKDDRYIVIHSLINIEPYQTVYTVWDLKVGTDLYTLKEKKEDDYSGKIIEISPNSKFIASTANDNLVKVWDLESGKCINILKGHANSISAIAISSNSKFIGTSSYDNTAKIWNSKNGSCLRTLSGHKDHLLSIAISNDNNFVITSSYDNTAKIWGIKSGYCLITFQFTRSISPVIFSSNNKFIAISAKTDATVLKIAYPDFEDLLKEIQKNPNPVGINEIEIISKITDNKKKRKSKIKKRPNRKTCLIQ